MKINILLGVFVSFLALLDLPRNDTTKGFGDMTYLHKTFIKADTIVVDTIDFNIVMYQEDAHASYYHDKFTGRKTASGAIFNNNELTCAHKTLPFGTKLKITSIKTGKKVKVTVTDRGPFIKGRDLDLSKKAFMKIAPTRYGGHIRVNIEIIREEQID